MRILYLLLLAAGGTLFLTGAAAGEQNDMSRCAELENDAQRLECYDAALREASAAPAQQESVTAPAADPVQPVPAAATPPTPAEPDATADDRFGLDDPPEPEPQEDEPDELRASISGIKIRRNGERIFTLDNGQVWVEKSPRPSLRVKVGDGITIKSGLFGSHRLFGSGDRSTAVDRIR